MKRSILKTSLALLAITLLLPGCLDIWFTTRVNPDGSLEQIIVFEGDSAEIADVPFALMNQEGWKKEWTQPDKDKHKLTVARKFKSVEEFNESMNPADTSLLVIRVNASLKKKFRWFFTRYVYEETIVKSDPFGHLDYRKFFTDDEIRLIAMEEELREQDPEFDSVKYKATEKNFEEFLLRSIYEDFFQQLLTIVKEDKSLTLRPEEIIASKEPVFRFLVDSVKGSESEEILDGMNRVIQHPDMQIIKEKYLNRFTRFQEKLTFFETTSDDGYRFTVRMPGLLLQTNSQEVTGSDISWKLSYYDFFFRDRTLTAESRMVNPWAFLVAGILLLLALGGLITTALRRRKTS